MSDNKSSILPDAIEPISNAIHQNLPETEKQADGALSAVGGFFNHVVLYPVKKANLTFRYKLEAFEDDLKAKISDIPDENLQPPPISVAGPALEALRYTYDEAELREMYENLLASSMDNRTVSKAHPAFVETIRQMNSLDARVISEISSYKQLRCITARFALKDSSQMYINGMPDYFVEELSHIADPFLVSSSLINLRRLGLINIIDGSIQSADYETLKSAPYIQSRKKIFEAFGKEIEIKISNHAVVANDYGKQFIEVCLGKER